MLTSIAMLNFRFRTKAIQIILTALYGVAITLVIRLSICLPQYRNRKKLRSKCQNSLRTLIFFGSGGHTTEMIQLIRNLSVDRFGPVYFILSHSDTTSKDKIVSANLPIMHRVVWDTVFRSREVKQSWISTVFTTVRSMLESFLLILRIRPDLIVCNGPGTCVPICYSAFLLRVLVGPLMDCDPSIVFVESFCRYSTILNSNARATTHAYLSATLFFILRETLNLRSSMSSLA
jgi:beta-1,4-N-acetylglucosaminyltransferase